MELCDVMSSLFCLQLPVKELYKMHFGQRRQKKLKIADWTTKLRSQIWKLEILRHKLEVVAWAL